MTEELKPGDIVRLISGSPAMTLTGVQLMMSENLYDIKYGKCVWFYKGEAKEQLFPLNCLVRFEYEEDD